MENQKVNAVADLLMDPGFEEGVAWHRRQYPANTLIFDQGETSRSVFMVVAGVVQAAGSAKTSDGKELKPSFTTFGAGEIFGELTLFDRLPRSARVSTLEESEVVEIDGDALMAYMESHPERGFLILRQIACSLVERLRETNTKLFSLYAWGLKAHGIDKYL